MVARDVSAALFQKSFRIKDLGDFRACIIDADWVRCADTTQSPCPTSTNPIRTTCAGASASPTWGAHVLIFARRQERQVAQRGCAGRSRIRPASLNGRSTQLGPTAPLHHTMTRLFADAMGTVDNASLLRWRSLDSVVVLLALADFAKQDNTYVPEKAAGSTRWHASVLGRDFELLLTGPKFWNTRERVGGGGAVDLSIHLTGFNFVKATALLSERRL